MNDRDFDIIIFGATGFTGQFMVEYLAKEYGASGNTKWAVAGRREEGLRKVLQQADAPNIEMIITDSSDLEALTEMASRTRAVIAAAGPYMKVGSNVVAACAAAGTDYVDITGEHLWVAKMLEEHQETAKKTGARIVHCCGFDSIPFDVGVYFTQQKAKEKFGAPADSVKGRVMKLDTVASGGSAASALDMVEAMLADKSLREKAENPYLVAQDPSAQRPVQPDIRSAQFDQETDQWAMYFPMSGANMAMVHRSNMLLGYDYGQGFKYSEMIAVKSGAKARVRTFVMTAVVGMMAFGPFRGLVRRLMPKQGEGPTPEKIANGSFELKFFAKGPGGQELQTVIASDIDAGYGATPKLAVETAFCLIQDRSRETTPGGIYSPASAMKDAIINRLHQKNILTFNLA